jgi:hypothetical protein
MRFSRATTEIVFRMQPQSTAYSSQDITVLSEKLGLLALKVLMMSTDVLIHSVQYVNEVLRYV